MTINKSRDIFRYLLIYPLLIFMLGWSWFFLYPYVKAYLNDAELVLFSFVPSNIHSVPCLNNGKVIYPVSIDFDNGIVGFDIVGLPEDILIYDYSNIGYCINGSSNSAYVVRNQNFNSDGFSVVTKNNIAPVITVKSIPGCEISGVYDSVVVVICDAFKETVVFVAINIESGIIENKFEAKREDKVVGYYGGDFLIYDSKTRRMLLSSRVGNKYLIDAVSSEEAHNSVFYKNNLYLVRQHGSTFEIIKWEHESGEVISLSILEKKPQMLSVNDGVVLFSVLHDESYDIYYIDENNISNMGRRINIDGSQVYPIYSEGYVYWAENFRTPISFLSSVIFGTQYSQYYIYRKPYLEELKDSGKQ